MPNKRKQHKDLELQSHAKSADIHEQYRGKPEFAENIKQLDERFKKRFMEIFKK